MIGCDYAIYIILYITNFECVHIKGCNVTLITANFIINYSKELGAVSHCCRMIPVVQRHADQYAII